MEHTALITTKLNLTESRSAIVGGCKPLQMFHNQKHVLHYQFNHTLLTTEHPAAVSKIINVVNSKNIIPLVTFR